jgi:hypothetical protein
MIIEYIALQNPLQYRFNYDPMEAIGFGVSTFRVGSKQLQL